MKTFLLFDGLGLKNNFILRLVKALADDGLEARLWYKSGSPLAEYFKEKNWLQKKCHQPLNSFWLSLILSPILWLKNLINLLIYKKKFKVESVVCLGWGAKFLVTIPAKLAGLKVVWLELPNFDYNDLGTLTLKFYKSLAGLVSLVCFSLTTKLSLLALGINEDNIALIWPGIEASEFQSQSDLFQNIANRQSNLKGKKYFTLGTVVDFKEPQRIEILMRSVKEAIAIVPNLRLIVIGDGSARQQAQWLSRQLNLESAVWLVGSQADLKKWYANFDIFVVASSMPGLDDFLVVLAAMVNGVPVIAPKGLSLEDCFLGGQAGILLSLSDAEELSATIIKLQQDQALRKSLSNNARRVAKDFFSLDRAKEEFKKVLSSNL